MERMRKLSWWLRAQIKSSQRVSFYLRLEPSSVDDENATLREQGAGNLIALHEVESVESIPVPALAKSIIKV